MGGSVVGELLGVLEDHYTQRLGVALDLHQPVKQRSALLLWRGDGCFKLNIECTRRLLAGIRLVLMVIEQGYIFLILRLLTQLLTVESTSLLGRGVIFN